MKSLYINIVKSYPSGAELQIGAELMECMDMLQYDILTLVDFIKENGLEVPFLHINYERMREDKND